MLGSPASGRQPNFCLISLSLRLVWRTRISRRSCYASPMPSRKNESSLFPELEATPKSRAKAFKSDLASAPLAERMRPRTLEEFVGQEHLLAPGKLLRRLIEEDRLTSLVFWG